VSGVCPLEPIGENSISSTKTAPAHRPLFSSCAGMTRYAFTVVVEVIEATVLQSWPVGSLISNPCHLTPALETHAKACNISDGPAAKHLTSGRANMQMNRTCMRSESSSDVASCNPCDASVDSASLAQQSSSIPPDGHLQFHNNSDHQGRWSCGPIFFGPLYPAFDHSPFGISEISPFVLRIETNIIWRSGISLNRLIVPEGGEI
jgi:hypothetical protein